MKLLHGQVASKSSETLSSASYARVSAEYYDAKLHPTCADFRSACTLYIETLFKGGCPTGRIADVGCGQSLLAEFISGDLILVDESQEMLDRNSEVLEKRQINISRNSFGRGEFDWIFAILADPYNELSAWRNIELALKRNGRCVFIVPSYAWAKKFRESSKQERAGFARFDLADGASVFLPSLVFPVSEQQVLVADAGLCVKKVEHVLLKDLTVVRSSKIFGVLNREDAILDIYHIEK